MIKINYTRRVASFASNLTALPMLSDCNAPPAEDRNGSLASRGSALTANALGPANKLHSPSIRSNTVPLNSR